MTTTHDLRNQRVLVVGLGESGFAAAELLLRAGARVVLNDRRGAEVFGARLAALQERGVEAVLGAHEASLFTSADCIVVSPGVPPLDAIDAADDAGIPVLSEVELASRFISSTVIGITGTNGKSTVTTLVGEMCRRTGRPTFVGGNLGTPLTSIVGTDAASKDGFAVIELSSFQLERVDSFRAHVALLLNVTEDHLDRYATFAEYAAAKGRIFHGQLRTDTALVPTGDALCVSLARAGAARTVTFGAPDGLVRVDGDHLVNGSSGLRLRTSEIPMRGLHNLQNACAAAAAANVAGVPAEIIASVLRDTKSLPHRMQWVRTLEGVDYFDDSKATNVGATVAALEGLRDIEGCVVLVAGGKDKGGSYEPLRRAFEHRGRALVLIGEAAPTIARAFEGVNVPVEHASSMDDAVRRCRTLARPGDAVLLAPACSSFDMFRSYAERGDAFQHAVRTLAEQP